MRPDTVMNPPLIAWGMAGRALPGQPVSGDLHLVKPFTGGVFLAVVDGLGHGDEATAAATTALAVLESHITEPLGALVKRCHKALTRTRGVVMTLATLTSLDGRLTWLGVGNVEAVLFRTDNRPGAVAGSAGVSPASFSVEDNATRGRDASSPRRYPDTPKAPVEGALLPASGGPPTLSGPAQANSERVLLRGGIVGYQLPDLQSGTLSISPGDLLIFATDGINARFTKDLVKSHSPQQLADSILERHCKGTDDALVLVVRYLGPPDE